MPSAAYDRALADATAHHATSKTYSGKFLRPHKPFLTDLIKRLGVASILDYGCGKGSQYTWIDEADGKTLEQAWGIEVFKYDPACPPFTIEPQGAFDLVLITHVLGGIPVEDLEWLFTRLYGFTTKAIYFAEKVGPIKKKVFSDTTAMPHDWSAAQWLEFVKPFAKASKAETHFSFRHKDEATGNVYIDRCRWAGNRWIKTSNRPK